MQQSKFDKNMSAIAFAEAGEHETAKAMLQEAGQQKKEKNKGQQKKPVAGMVIFGAISLAGYVALLTHQDLVTELFTRGGINTLWPIGTAFLFSFIHGAFASNFLSVLGISAKK